MNPSSERRLEAVHPYLAFLVRRLATILAARSVRIEVTQGLRTYREQEALYAKGRTAPGPRVTPCQPGHSYHNFGLAVDIVPEDLYGTPDWNGEHPVWAVIHEEALTLGFTCGADFRTAPKDQPHLQLTGKLPAEVTDTVRQAYLDGGLASVWREAQLPPVPVPPYNDVTSGTV